VPSNTASHPSASSSASNANYASQFTHQTHVAHADTTTTMYLATTPSVVTKAARNVHTILLLVTLLLSYPPRWRQQDTSTQTPNWTSTHTYTSNLTPLHDRSTSIQQPGLAVSKSYSSLLTNATHTFHRHHQQHLILSVLFPGSL
jgi:hypothetical protein